MSDSFSKLSEISLSMPNQQKPLFVTDHRECYRFSILHKSHMAIPDHRRYSCHRSYMAIPDHRQYSCHRSHMAIPDHRQYSCHRSHMAIPNHRQYSCHRSHMAIPDQRQYSCHRSHKAILDHRQYSCHRSHMAIPDHRQYSCHRSHMAIPDHRQYSCHRSHMAIPDHRKYSCHRSHMAIPDHRQYSCHRSQTYFLLLYKSKVLKKPHYKSWKEDLFQNFIFVLAPSIFFSISLRTKDEFFKDCLISGVLPPRSQIICIFRQCSLAPAATPPPIPDWLEVVVRRKVL